jgi:hypothetical protein
MVWSANRQFGLITKGLKGEREATVDLPPVKFLEAVTTEK